MNQRILFATDVPFWWQSTGAEQRIFGIHRFLEREGSTCGVFYLNALSSNDEALIAKLGIQVFAVSSNQPPERLLNRIRWYADATINQARSWLARSNDNVAVVDGPESLTLDDFVWPWALTRFAEIAGTFKPDCIIFEYIKMAYLMDALPDAQRNQVECLIDTHDVLYRRAEQFFANGFPHWLEIDREGEAEVLKKFDAVIAIQDQEANMFREMTDSKIPVLTVGHAVDEDAESELPDSVNPESELPSKIAVGYIGSKNFSNWQAIRDFLNCAWPSVAVKHPEKCELLIAGDICEWFDVDANGKLMTSAAQADLPENAFDQVRLLGRVDKLSEFYDQIDVVINPVQFGTGLKIKNAESLRFGKLLITTLNGFDGMPEATRLACKVVEDVNEMGLAINSICKNLPSIRPMQKLALQLAQTEFSEQHAYSELRDYLNANLPA